MNFTVQTRRIQSKGSRILLMWWGLQIIQRSHFIFIKY